MINLTYEIVCDLCSKECGTQQYSCHGFPLAEIPKPRLDFSYCLQKFKLELCNDCAAPLMKTLDTTIRARNERLREALETYGQHRNNCAVVLGGYQCTCGFNQQEQPR